MTNNKLLIAIKDATKDINNNSEKLKEHQTELLFVLDAIIGDFEEKTNLLLNKDAYLKIIEIERETMLLDTAIILNGSAITVDDETTQVIKFNCDDLLTKVDSILTFQRSRLKEFGAEYGSGF